MAEKKTTAKTEQTEKKQRAKKAAAKTEEPEISAAPAQNVTQAPAEPEQPKERMYTEAEVQAMIASLLAKNRPEEDTVRLYFTAVCAKNNAAELPGYGVIRPGQYLEIPKKEFGGKFMSPQARKFIEKRRLLVLDGLNESERRRWNCDYKRGEVLDENAFDHLLDMKDEELIPLFNALCKEHKEFVARYIISMVDQCISGGKRIDNRLSLQRVRALNEASKTETPEGMLAKTVEIIRDNL